MSGFASINLEAVRHKRWGDDVEGLVLSGHSFSSDWEGPKDFHVTVFLGKGAEARDRCLDITEELMHLHETRELER